MYVGRMRGGAVSADATGRVVIYSARHLCRYTVNGGRGDASVSDLAVRGLAESSPSVSDPVPGATVLLGVRRILDVAAQVADSFGVPE